jgi:hypothetical protein
MFTELSIPAKTMSQRIFKIGSESSVPFTDQELAADEVIVEAQQFWGGPDGMTSLVKWDEATNRHIVLDESVVLAEQAAKAQLAEDKIKADDVALTSLLKALDEKTQTPDQLADAVRLLLKSVLGR